MKQQNLEIFFAEEGNRGQKYLGRYQVIHTYGPSEIVEFFIPGLQKFQLEQTANNHLHMRLMVKGGPQQVKELAAKRMHEILSAKQLDQVVTFSGEVVKEIPLNPKTGKFNLILPFKKK